MSPKCTTTVLGMSLELLVMVMDTISALQANRLLIPRPHDFLSRIFLFVRVQVKSLCSTASEESFLDSSHDHRLHISRPLISFSSASYHRMVC